MISFNIRCSNEHVFEAWFNNSAAYEDQARAGEIACPICGDTNVEKAPMAPRVNMGRSRAVSKKMPSPAMVREVITEMHRHVKENCEDVGDQFAEEARRIHYGESEERGIHGQASGEEVEELVEENINVFQLPDLPRSDA